MASLALAGLGAASMSFAEEGRVFTAPQDWLSIEFPKEPVVSQVDYPAVTPTGATVKIPATRYAVEQGGTRYLVTVARTAGSIADDPHILDNAVTAFRKRGGLALDTAVSHSLGNASPDSAETITTSYQLCGRQFGYKGRDDSLNYRTLFYNPNTHLLYDIFSSVTPAAQAEHGADVSHFQWSLALLADPASRPAPAPVFPESWKLYDYSAAGFSIRFPDAPTVEKARYRTDGGVDVPATRYQASADGVLYRLTVAEIWQSGADDANAVDEGVRVWKRQGAVLSDDSVAVSAAQCGRDVAVRTTDGRKARAWIFFPSSQHRLYVIETSGPGDGAEPAGGAFFRQSFTVAKPQ